MIKPEEEDNIRHMIDTMLHFLNGGEVLSRPIAFGESEKFQLDLAPEWNWGRYEYMQAPKKKVLYAVFHNEALIHVTETLKEMEMLQSNPRCLSYGLPITKFVES